MIGPPITANSANITTNDHLISDFFIESPPIILVKIAVGKMPCLSAGHSFSYLRRRSLQHTTPLYFIIAHFAAVGKKLVNVYRHLLVHVSAQTFNLILLTMLLLLKGGLLAITPV